MPPKRVHFDGGRGGRKAHRLYFALPFRQHQREAP
jgi:hypothetical protein